ncbi:MAG: hypothetical protein COU85_01615, partial [Candidatus Portnoybacteria bacterium CG10_big_fil_rev_8_21_14_0_10_44_7]
MADHQSQMKNLLIITLSLSPQNGLGRYSREMVKRLSAKYRLAVFTSREKDGLTEVAGGQIFPILPGLFRFYRLSNPLTVLWYFLKIWPRAKKSDFIHCLMDFPYSFLAALLAWLARKPLFLTAHGTYSLTPFGRWPDRWFYEFTLRRAKK